MIPAIETQGLSHQYRSVQALEEVDLEVPEGSFFALLGPNGAGKTTLMKVILGILRPTKGEVFLRGKDLKNLTAQDRRWLGYVAEGQRLPGWMTLHQCEAFLEPLYPSWDRSLANHLRERFRLDSRRKIKTLSRGEQMKATLLTALAPRPQVLVMDEPFTGMDALVKDELVYGILELANTNEWTVFMCSQDIGEMESLADHVGFLDHGRLILSEPLDVLHERFKRVTVDLPAGTLIDPTTAPPTWLSPRRSGNRMTFVTSEHGTPGGQRETEAFLPREATVTARPASLRDVFVALAAEGLGGPGRNGKGGSS